ncbi:MAG: flagellar motor switch protein FliN [Bacillota bacterium]
MSSMSQEEIDRLLNGAMSDSGEQEQAEDATAKETPDNVTVQFEELREIGASLAEAGTDALRAALNRPVKMAVANAVLQTMPEVLTEYQSPMLLMEGTYAKGLSGGVLLLIKEQDAALLAELLGTGADGTDVPAVLTKAMHQMFGAQDIAISEMIKTQVQTVLGDMAPVLPESPGMLRWIGESEPLAALHLDVDIDSATQMRLIQMMPQKTVDMLMDVMGRGDGGGMSDGGEQINDTGGHGSVADEARPAPKSTQGMGEIRSMKARDQQTLKKEPKGIQNMRYQSFDKKREPQYNAGVHDNIGMIIDMPLQVTVELGKVSMSIKEILAFNLGSIIELDRMADELVDVKVNGKLIARGEIVVVDENYGVRITDIVSPERRVKSY